GRCPFTRLQEMEWNSVSDTEREETETSASEQIDLSTAAEQSATQPADDGGVEAGLNAALDAASAPEGAAAEDDEATPDEPEVDPYEEFRNELKYLPGKWYVIHSYSGFEKRVKQNIENRRVS